MNSYFLHNGIESSGPFTLEELKSKNIKPNTPVWCQGMPDWKTAAEVEELKSLLVPIPPPIKTVVTPVVTSPAPVTATTPVENIETHAVSSPKKKKRIFGLKRSVFYFICFFGILIIASFFLSVYQQNRREKLELLNKQTEKNNIQFRLQQKEIEEQKIQLAIQEKIEADRILKEKKENIQNKIFNNKELLIVANTNFEEAKKQLAEASNFQFLRSAAEREEEINEANKQIAHWKNEMEKIEDENHRLSLELERLH
ncbi:DUF4339 domain-containing protein [Flavobacterium sp. UMI-01]|uniref:DUF4339 domain-containing protein n=1 Tax=Flavobacterium sp. UMI-01 TaxID=1441053 RepID=UPI001C7DE50D|nr:DUF4339 domain-containing protein [Flavobacterium sp. UMI-01]GIZ08143.1 hypothetical protein FUMI01_08700 [Flavobacterium sp. UMI-01]